MLLGFEPMVLLAKYFIDNCLRVIDGEPLRIATSMPQEVDSHTARQGKDHDVPV